MTIVLRVSLLAFAVGFTAIVLWLVAGGKLRLKYSLLWMALATILILCALFPRVVSWLTHLVGIATPSNFVFLVGLVCLLGIALALTAIVSWQARDIRTLIQRVSLLEKRLDDRGNGKKSR